MRPDWKIDWNEKLWNKLSDAEIRATLGKLPEVMQAEILLMVGRGKLYKIGWVRVCAGCGKDPYDCGCPAGTSLRPPE